MADKIATESEAAQKGGGSSSSNKCCTKERAEALECKVQGSYQDNQLVLLRDLSPNKELVGFAAWTKPFDRGFIIFVLSSKALDYDVTLKLYIVSGDKPNLSKYIDVTLPKGKTQNSFHIQRGNPLAYVDVNIESISPLNNIISVTANGHVITHAVTVVRKLSEAVDYDVNATLTIDGVGDVNGIIPKGETAAQSGYNTSGQLAIARITKVIPTLA